MNLLFDTNAFYWWDQEPDRLSVSARERIEDEGNVLVLSVVSVWEMVIKQGLGKLDLDDAIADIVATQVRENSVRLLPVSLEHVLAVGELPSHHRDPFDRLLIAQARVEGLTILTPDPEIHKYPVAWEW